MILKTLNEVRHLSFMHSVGAHFKVSTRDYLLRFDQNTSRNKKQENEEDAHGFKVNEVWDFIEFESLFLPGLVKCWA